MKVRLRGFGSIEVEGREYDHDIVIEGGRIRKRKKKPSKPYRSEFGHTPLSADEELPLGRKPADHRHGGLRLAADHARGHQRGWTAARGPHRHPHRRRMPPDRRPRQA